jgi:hypothetical protein
MDFAMIVNANFALSTGITRLTPAKKLPYRQERALMVDKVCQIGACNLPKLMIVWPRRMVR